LGEVDLFLRSTLRTVFPLQRNESDRHCIQKAAAVQPVSDPSYRVYFGRELNPLAERWPPFDKPNFGGQRLAQREQNVAVIMRVLKNGIPPIRIKPPAGWLDNFMIAVECSRAGDEIERRCGATWTLGRF